MGQIYENLQLTKIKLYYATSKGNIFSNENKVNYGVWIKKETNCKVIRARMISEK